MEYRTYLELRTKVEKDLDLEDEQFIQPEELLGYFNSAIDDAEAEIHTLYEDYFLDDISIPLVKDQEYFDLPTNIYALKIRAVLYVNGDEVWPIHKARNSNKFMVIQEMKNTSGVYRDYRYIIRNKASYAKPMLQLIPKSRETGPIIHMEYIRNANRMIDDTSICDIPEFTEYVIQYVKVKCYEKEGHPNLGSAIDERERLRKQMVDTLSNMVPDAETTMEMDMSHYEEST